MKKTVTTCRYDNLPSISVSIFNAFCANHSKKGKNCHESHVIFFYLRLFRNSCKRRTENNAVCQMTIYFLCFVLSRFAVPEHISNQFWLLCCSQFILCRWWSKMAEWRRKTIRKKSRRTRPLTHTWRKSAHCQLKTISRIPNFWPISFRLVDRPSQHTYTQTSVASISTSLVFRRYACKNTTIV